MKFFAWCCCNCAQLVFFQDCGRTLTVVDGNSVNWPVDTYVGIHPATQLLPSGTYTWTATSPNGCMVEETGEITIVCPQGVVNVTVPITPATGYVDAGPTCGCCQVLPECFAMTVNDPALNYGIFQNATLAWQEMPASLAPLGFGEWEHLSTIQFEDNLGYLFWYLLYCFNGSIFLVRVYEESLFGSPYAESAIYRWGFNDGCEKGTPAVFYQNTCCPSFYGCGETSPGYDPASIVILEEC